MNASGIVHRIVHPGARVTHVSADGAYVGFEYVAKPKIVLDVFDALTGHTELRTVIGNQTIDPETDEPHGGSVDNEQPACLDPWRLAPNGWVAEIEDCHANGALEGLGLTVIQGAHHIVDLDAGLGVSDLHLNGSTLTWSGARIVYSAPLGAQLNALGARTLPPPTPLPAVCVLLASADAQAVLGPVTQSSAGDGCTYTAIGGPKSTLNLTLQSDLTPTQVTVAKQAAYKAESYYDTKPANLGAYTWSALWDTTSGGEGESHEVRFVGDVELTTELLTAVGQLDNPTNEVAPGVISGSIVLTWHPEEAVSHFADIAFDRLMGWPVSYSG